MKKILFLAYLVAICFSQCVHDEFIKNTTKHYYDDLSDRRMLQGLGIGPLRIFADYSQVVVGDQTQKHIIKRIMNITTNYFYKLLQVDRLSKLYYPSGSSLQCNVLTIPAIYRTLGLDADLGVVVGSQYEDVIYLAKSTPCAFLTSNQRPIWGMAMFNIKGMKYDNEGFQQMTASALHELTHILAFSALMYSTYPGPLQVTGSEFTQNFLTSPKINAEVQAHFGCPGKGLELQDQDGTLIASHWEKHSVGVQFMIASVKKNVYVSRFTLALFDSTGWYYNVDYSFAQKSTWGKGKGCAFMDIDNCEFDEFCTGSSFDCDWDGTGIGKCNLDKFLGVCKIFSYYTNTICIDENYQLKNLNSRLAAVERGGDISRCFRSDYRAPGLTPNSLNNRCYQSACNAEGNYIYVLVNGFILICRKPAQEIPAIPGLEGSFFCPDRFQDYCGQKGTCSDQCSQNGYCVNNQCLCTGSLSFTLGCDYPDVNIDPLQGSNTGGRTLFEVKNKKSSYEYDIDSECEEGLVFDPITQQCESCDELLGCQNCNELGCLSSEGQKETTSGYCQ